MVLATIGLSSTLTFALGLSVVPQVLIVDVESFLHLLAESLLVAGPAKGQYCI